MPFAAEKIRVGRDYQAVCPELEPLDQRKPEQMSDRALLVWSPTAEISDAKCKLCETYACPTFPSVLFMDLRGMKSFNSTVNGA